MQISLKAGNLFVIFSLLIFAGCGKQPVSGSGAGDVSAAAVPKYSAEAFFATTSYGLAGGNAYSPDYAKLLVHSDATGIFNVYALPVDGSDAIALTESGSDAMFAVSWFR